MAMFLWGLSVPKAPCRCSCFTSEQGSPPSVICGRCRPADPGWCRPAVVPGFLHLGGPLRAFRAALTAGLEDLINDPLVLAFPRWLDSSSRSSAGSLGPTAQGTACLMAQRAGAAEQATAINKRTALPPVVPFGCDPDEHFTQSIFVQRHGTPLDWESPVDDDVRFAAACMAVPLSDLQARREDSLSWFEELAHRLAPVSALARARQRPDVAAVNPRVRLALLAALVVLLAWPDTSFVHGLCAGFPAVGYCHPCGVWPAKPGSLCTLDEEWEELLGQSRPFRLIRRFVITQSTGKKRCVDDALASRQRV